MCAEAEALADIYRAARFYYLQHHAFGDEVAAIATTRHCPTWPG